MGERGQAMLPELVYRCAALPADAPLRVVHYPRRAELLQGLEEHPPVVKLRWFTRGYYAAKEEHGSVVVTDLRMGSEPYYVFRFKVAIAGNPHPSPVKDEQLRTDINRRQLAWVWKRIWSPQRE